MLDLDSDRRQLLVEASIVAQVGDGLFVRYDQVFAERVGSIADQVLAGVEVTLRLAMNIRVRPDAAVMYRRRPSSRNKRELQATIADGCEVDSIPFLAIEELIAAQLTAFVNDEKNKGSDAHQRNTGCR